MNEARVYKRSGHADKGLSETGVRGSWVERGKANLEMEGFFVIGKGVPHVQHWLWRKRLRLNIDWAAS